MRIIVGVISGFILGLIIGYILALYTPIGNRYFVKINGPVAPNIDALELDPLDNERRRFALDALDDDIPADYIPDSSLEKLLVERSLKEHNYRVLQYCKWNQSCVHDYCKSIGHIEPVCIKNCIIEVYESAKKGIPNK